MKKLILMLCLAFQISQAQQTCRDSALVQIQKDFRHIRSNIEAAKDYQVTGNVLHLVGIWSQVIAFTGYKQQYYDVKTYQKVALYSIGFNLMAYGFHLYSHKFVNRAALEVRPGSVKIKF